MSDINHSINAALSIQMHLNDAYAKPGTEDCEESTDEVTDAFAFIFSLNFGLLDELLCAQQARTSIRREMI